MSNIGVPILAPNLFVVSGSLLVGSGVTTMHEWEILRIEQSHGKKVVHKRCRNCGKHTLEVQTTTWWL